MKKVIWNKKKFFRNFIAAAIVGFFIYEFVLYLNEVITFCVNYCD